MIVSGTLYRGNESELLFRLIDGQFINVTSNEMLAELKAVLERPKFGLNRYSINFVLKIIQVFSEEIGDATIRKAARDLEHSLPKKLDPGDRKVLVCSAASGCHYISTGDTELLNLGSFLECEIIRPLEMISIIDGYLDAKKDSNTKKS